jgi:hypothetical protein
MATSMSNHQIQKSKIESLTALTPANCFLRQTKSIFEGARPSWVQFQSIHAFKLEDEAVEEYLQLLLGATTNGLVLNIDKMIGMEKARE